jgi:HD-like signal output (HDOD) protein
MMPVMDGSQLLAEVARKHPQTVRMVLSGQAEREAVLRLVGPAHQFLSKPCEADELRKAVSRAFALRDLLGNERLKELTTKINHLPTLPSLQEKLNEELQKESPSIEKIGEIISRDVGMTAKILQLVNSAFFGLAQPINTPADAVVYLGMNTVRALVLSLGIFLQYEKKSCRTFSLDVMAEHSWVTGTLAQTIARHERRSLQIVDQCFLAGLLHDIGQLVLAFGLPEEYDQVVEKAKTGNHQVWQVEQEFFGATHADVGAYLLALWGLPNPVVEAVALHHVPAHSAALEFSPTVAVHASDVFAHQLTHDPTELPPPQLDLGYLARIGCGERIEQWLEQCQQAINPET